MAFMGNGDRKADMAHPEWGTYWKLIVTACYASAREADERT